MDPRVGSLDVLGSAALSPPSERADRDIDVDMCARARYQHRLRQAGVDVSLGVNIFDQREANDPDVVTSNVVSLPPQTKNEKSDTLPGDGGAKVVDELEGLLKRLETLEAKKARWAARAERLVHAPDLSPRTPPDFRRGARHVAASPLRFAQPISPTQLPVPAQAVGTPDAEDDSAIAAGDISSHFRALSMAASKRWLSESEVALFLLCVEDAVAVAPHIARLLPTVPFVPPRPSPGCLFLVDREIAKSMPSLSYVQWREDGYAAAAPTEAKKLLIEVENERTDEGLVGAHLRFEKVLGDASQGSEPKCIVRRAYRSLQSACFCDAHLTERTFPLIKALARPIFAIVQGTPRQCRRLSSTACALSNDRPSNVTNIFVRPSNQGNNSGPDAIASRFAS